MERLVERLVEGSVGEAAQADLTSSVMQSMADPVVAIAPDTTLLYANRAAEARFGWSLDELVGTSVVHLAHPEDLDTALISLSSVLEKETGTLVEIRLRDQTGQYSRFEIRGRAWADGPVPGAVVLNVREVTDRSGWDLSRGDAELLGSVLEHLPIVTLLVDAHGTIRGSNRALTRTLARPVEGTRGQPFLELVSESDRAELRAALAELAGTSGTCQQEIGLLCADGSTRPVHLVAVDLTTDRAVRGLLLVATDISALVQARQELRHLAEHDDLTGLPNRVRLHDHLSAILEAAVPPAHTVVFGDVNDLKPINDRHGHTAGDALLKQVADRLQRVLRPDDVVARLSGDEFVLVLATDDPATVGAVQARIDALMAEPVELPDGTVVTTSISLGVAPVEPHVSAEELLAAADAAMYVAKRERLDARGPGAG